MLCKQTLVAIEAVRFGFGWFWLVGFVFLGGGGIFSKSISRDSPASTSTPPPPKKKDDQTHPHQPQSHHSTTNKYTPTTTTTTNHDTPQKTGDGAEGGLGGEPRALLLRPLPQDVLPLRHRPRVPRLGYGLSEVLPFLICVVVVVILVVVVLRFSLFVCRGGDGGNGGGDGGG